MQEDLRKQMKEVDDLVDAEKGGDVNDLRYKHRQETGGDIDDLINVYNSAPGGDINHLLKEANDAETEGNTADSLAVVSGLAKKLQAHLKNKAALEAEIKEIFCSHRFSNINN